MSTEERTGPETHTINNMDEFAKFLSDSGFFVMEESLGIFYDAYLGINKGCGCSKRKRVNHTVNLYRGMKDTLSHGSKMAIRGALQVNIVELKHDEELICSF